LIGRTLSHYRVEDRLGAGGMGVVYLARDLALDRLAALKVLPRGFDPALRLRLMREARACASLQHPGIATFFETGEEGGEVFVAMEYVRGKTLRAVLREGALPPQRAVAVAEAILESLSHAHAAGVLHRDVKPENVMISDEGRVKLLDFGLAKHLAAQGSGGELPTLSLLTSEGAIVGTPGFLAPEQLRGDPSDGRADLFAVGAILYELLSGAPAFPGATPMARAAATLSVDPPLLRAGGMPAGTEEVLFRALSRDPARRYATAGEFLAGLHRLGEGSPAAGPGDRIVVVDFENLSGRPEDAWIGTGIAETLVSDLSRHRGLQVVAREGVMKARAGSSEPMDSHALGQRLGCRWTVGGSYQRVGPALRTLGGGHLLVQALAGLAQAGGRAAAYEEARSLFLGRPAHDFSWFWSATDDFSLLELARAARTAGRPDESLALLERARIAVAGQETPGGEGSGGGAD
jgi:predicted Ser/Thr protein kinase